MNTHYCHVGSRIERGIEARKADITKAKRINARLQRQFSGEQPPLGNNVQLRQIELARAILKSCEVCRGELRYETDQTVPAECPVSLLGEQQAIVAIRLSD